MQAGSTELDAYCRDFAWHQSIFAPGLHILQAQTEEGETASGAGRTRPVAYARCLAEAAELHALRAAGGKAALGFLPRRDGLAAHPDPDTARLNARLEAFERHCVSRWWHGQMAARPLCATWLSVTGITDRIVAERRDTAQKRPCRFWLIDGTGDTCVAICRSTSLQGQEPILGFGCHGSVTWAVMKALREALLMELNLMTLQVARRNGTMALHLPLRDAIATWALRTPMLLPDGAPVAPPPDLARPTLPDWFTFGLDVRDITPPDRQIAVWMCQTSRTAADSAGSPYL